MRWLQLAVVIGGLVCHGVSARASPLELYGFGARSSSMAGAGVSSSDDFESVYLNPAGLADASGKRLSIGGLYGSFGLKLDGNRTDTDRAVGAMWGGAFRLPLGGALKDRVGVGVGLYIPSKALVRVDVPNTGQPVFALLETRSYVVGIMAALGVRVTDRLQVGGGVLALSALRGTIFIDADAGGQFRSESQQQLITGLAPIVGARYRFPRQHLVIGAVFRGESRSDYSIEITNALGDDLPLTLPTITVAGTAQFDPLMVAAEASWNATRHVQLTGQLAYQRWSAFPPPTQTPTELGQAMEPPGFHDTVVPRLAMEASLPTKLARLSLRAGYAFAWSPAPEMVGQQSLLDNHRHVIAVGMGLAWPGRALPLYIDLWAQTHLLMSRKHTKDPSLFDSPEDIPFDDVRASGHLFVGGMTLGVDL